MGVAAQAGGLSEAGLVSTASPAPAVPTSSPALPAAPPPALFREITPAGVSAWFDAAADTSIPAHDSSLQTAREAADAYALSSKAPNTRLAYRAAVRAWCAWCATHGLTPLPACSEDVRAFLAHERGRGLRPTTIELRRAAIRYLHLAAGAPVPTGDGNVSATMAGIVRTAARAGVRPRKKAAATEGILRQIFAKIPDDCRGVRDRALLAVGFAGALRRSELAAIRCEDLTFCARGLLLTLPVTKGEQADAVTVALPYGDTELCPVRALARWRTVGFIDEGPVFRRMWNAPAPVGGGPPPLPWIGKAALTGQAVAMIIQARAVAAGFGRLELGGHSLRRGALTTGMDQGAHPARLKKLGRHKSFDVLGEYLEFGDPFEGHPLAGVL